MNKATVFFGLILVGGAIYVTADESPSLLAQEMAIVGAPGGARQVAAAGAAGVARKFASLQSQLDPSVIKYATANRLVGGVAITTVAQLEQCLLDAHLATYDQGGNPTYLFTAPATAGYISSFAYQSGRSRDLRNEKTFMNVIDLNEYGVRAA